MSSADVTIVRCDMPRCQTFARLPLDGETDPGDGKALHALLEAAGWHQFSMQGMLTYTADYCPTHKKATSEGIRGWGATPNPIREEVEGGLVVHRSRRAIRNGAAA